MNTLKQLRNKADRANKVHLTLSPIRQRNLSDTEEYLVDRLHHLAAQGNYRTEVTFSHWEPDAIQEVVNRLKKAHDLGVENTEGGTTKLVRWDTR